MIIETLITTQNTDGTLHLSAMGPEVDEALQHWQLKPFQSSTTFLNLRKNNRCVVHIIDDALLLAKVVTYQTQNIHADHILNIGYVLPSACRVFALEVKEWNLDEDRAIAKTQVIWQREQRPFGGWNRATHGILELAVDATRIGFIPETILQASIQHARRLVEKTGGEREQQALELLEEFVLRELASKDKNR